MSRRRWEYLVIDCGDMDAYDVVFSDATVKELDGYGRDGWEVVSVAENPRRSHEILLKREVSDE